MNILKYSATFVMACLAVALAASEKEIFIRIRPITRAQYESIMEVSHGKPVISEGRLIKSAISGLSNLAAGFQLDKYFPNKFGSYSQSSEGSAVLGGYPLCTINSNAATGRKIDFGSYLNINELKSSLQHTNGGSSDLPTMNCILVLDDNKGKPSHKKPMHTTTTTAKPPIYKPNPGYPHHPSYLPLPPYWPCSPIYRGHPYYPTSSIPYSHYIYDKNGDYEPETDNADESFLTVVPAEGLEDFIAKNLRVINSISTTPAITAKKTTKKSRRSQALRSQLNSEVENINREFQ